MLASLGTIALAAGCLVATPNPSAASAANPVTSIPIDVAFTSTNGQTAVLTQDQYTQVMTTTAQWWTTQAQGLLGPEPATRADALNRVTYALVHEMGHTVGLLHAAGDFVCSTGFDGQTYGMPLALDASDCLSYSLPSTYGDVTNIMGSPQYTWDRIGLSGYQKELFGIIQPGAGLASVTTPGTTSYTLTSANTPSTSTLQAIHVTDSLASPASDYVVDFPALPADANYPARSPSCTVRVERVIPSQAGGNAWGTTTTNALRATPLGIPDSLSVNMTQPGVDPFIQGSSEICLVAGSTYTSWSGNVAIKVTDVAADKSTASVQVVYGASAGAVPGVAVKITGTVQTGSPLTAIPTASVVPDSWTYQWLRDGQPIMMAGTTTDTYTPIAADIGHTLSVRATASKLGYATATAAAPATVTVPTPPPPTAFAWPDRDEVPQSAPRRTGSPRGEGRSQARRSLRPAHPFGGTAPHRQVTVMRLR